MTFRQFLFCMVLFVFGCGSTNISAVTDDESLLANIEQANISKQLKINADALLKGSTEAIRIDAATVILFSKDPDARLILIDALTETDYPNAQIAICKALSQTKAQHEDVRNKQDFIDPLMTVLARTNSELAKLAAEATLIFDYEQIAPRLIKIARDPEVAEQGRANAIDALKLQPDMRAIFALMDMLDDPAISTYAREALKSQSIPVAMDPQKRQQIKEELKRKGRNAFVRDLLLRQESRMNQLEQERNFWKTHFLEALDTIYNTTTDDTERGAFLIRQLNSPKQVIRLWALDKVSQWRVGTGKLPADLGPVLINLVSDPDTQVRLRTAQVLSLMSELNSAEKLLEQIERETDPDVRMELFNALGGACDFAFSPNSGIQLDPTIRRRTLDLALEYLMDPNTARAQRGAAVIKDLLEQNGLSPEHVSQYLDALNRRYQSATEENLRSELLTDMAAICAASVYRQQAVEQFEPLFHDVLKQPELSKLVRRAAVEGLVSIDKAAAFDFLRTGDVNETDPAIRKKTLELAREFATVKDLPWLFQTLGPNGKNELAWQAILRIFKDSDVQTILPWLDSGQEAVSENLSLTQHISLLEIAHSKAADQNDSSVLRSLRDRLSSLYLQTRQYDQAAQQLGLLIESEPSPDTKDQLVARLVGVYLKAENQPAVVEVVKNRLLTRDIDPNDAVIKVIDAHLNDQADPNKAAALIDALVKIAFNAAERPNWGAKIASWRPAPEVKANDQPAPQTTQKTSSAQKPAATGKNEPQATPQ